MSALAIMTNNGSLRVGVIRDADVSAESATFTKQKVLQEPSVAMLSQANAAPQIALRLLG